MADVHTKEVRSYNMSQIQSKNSKPELIVRKYLFANGFRYRLHSKNLPGKPDIVLAKYRTVIFVHGCFWHGHEECKYFVVPKTKTEWWVNKINGNKIKNSESINTLKKLEWQVVTIWECELKQSKRENKLNALTKYLKKRDE